MIFVGMILSIGSDYYGKNNICSDNKIFLYLLIFTHDAGEISVL